MALLALTRVAAIVWFAVGLALVRLAIGYQTARSWSPAKAWRAGGRSTVGMSAAWRLFFAALRAAIISAGVVNLIYAFTDVTHPRDLLLVLPLIFVFLTMVEYLTTDGDSCRR